GVAYADVGARVVPAGGASRVGVGALVGERDVVVVDQRFRTIGELERIGVEPGVNVADKGPARGENWFLELDADIRLGEATRHALPARSVVDLGNHLADGRLGIAIERRRVGLVTAAH